MTTSVLFVPLPFEAIFTVIKALLSCNLCVVAEIEVSSDAWGNPSEILVTAFFCSKSAKFSEVGYQGHTQIRTMQVHMIYCLQVRVR